MKTKAEYRLPLALMDVVAITIIEDA